LVDTAPLLERAWAVEAGLGWFGRNTCVINPTLGSTFVLGEIVMDEAVEPDEPLASRCGDCRLCLEACPARALSGGEGFVLDARRCLSYWTVETDRVRSPLPGGGDTFFGCDRCQLVCPWNRSDLTVETTLAPLERWQRLTLPLFAEADLETLNEMLRGTALERVGAAALRRRAAALTQSSSSSVPGSSSSGNGCSSCQR
jgi:epoxyqueuosine reductase